MNGDSDVSNFKCSAFQILLKKIDYKFGKHKKIRLFNKERRYDNVAS